MKIVELEHDTFEDNDGTIKSAKRPRVAKEKHRKFGKWRESVGGWPESEKWLNTENPAVWQGEI